VFRVLLFSPVAVPLWFVSMSVPWEVAMLFVYLFAMLMCVSVVYGCVVLLSLCSMPADLLFVFICTGFIALCVWSLYMMFHAARDELVYWF